MEREGKTPQRRGQSVKEATPDYLESAALDYLGRFSSSSENLRRVLLRKVRRSAEEHGTDEQAGAAVIDALIARFTQSKLLDDRAFAEARTRKLHARGGSALAIRARLEASGLQSAEIDRALRALQTAQTEQTEQTEQTPEAGEQSAEREAAWAYARRRRLGPYRSEAERKERRMRDLGAMARAGFSYAISCRIIDAQAPPIR